jgi:serine/threonine protein kinase
MPDRDARATPSSNATAENAAVGSRPTISQREMAGGESTASQQLHKPTHTATPAELGQLLASRYRLIRQLGAGAMGTVLQAEDTKLGRQVAIKLLPAESTPDPEAIVRFRREARALAQLSHANIVQVYDEDEDGGRHFLVMEFVEGRTLAAILKDQGRLPPTRAATYAWQTAQGLAHAHDRGLVHRDLKPSNLLITTEGQVKILDLGLARFLLDQIGDASLTLDGIGLGTPDYMAPEQFTAARRVDPRADVYSLGCTLYHMLAGQVPFPTSSISAKYAAHESQEPPQLEEACPDAPAGLTDAVHRMMAKRPEDRFASAAAAADALSSYVSGSLRKLLGPDRTTSWHGSQHKLQAHAHVAIQTRGRRWIAAISVSVACLGMLLVAMFASGMFNRERIADGKLAKTFPRNVQPDDAPKPPDTDKPPDTTATLPATPTPESPPEPPVPVAETDDDPNVLTVAQDGSGEYRSIGEALAAVQQFQTIRILDAGTYDERVSIDYPDVQTGLTIESSQGATLQSTAANQGILQIAGVPHVRVRGLRLRSKGPRQTLVTVKGAVPGLVLDRLDLQATAGPGEDCDGIALFGVTNPSDEEPVVIRGCKIQACRRGLVVLGTLFDGATPALTNRVVLAENHLLRPIERGILVGGQVAQVQIVGNRIEGTPLYSALEFQGLVEARELLAANNTFLRCSPALVILDHEFTGEQVELANNLMLACTGPDMLCFTLAPDQPEPRAGDPGVLKQHWKFRDNWREATAPAGISVLAQSWIPPEPDDVRRDAIEVLSRDPAQADFLRPAADSPLAGSGAGGDLPGYVGAVPPAGAEAWDWTKTWESRHPGRILTVSQDPADGGRFRTLGEALRAVMPGMTIRLRDGATYEETLRLENRTGQANLTIEGPRGAVLTSVEDTAALAMIVGVPGVTLRGLTLRAKGKKQTQVAVVGAAPGLLLAGLRLDATNAGDCDGIIFYGSNIRDNQPPAMVRDCEIRGGQVGIALRGATVLGSPTPCRRILVADNVIHRPTAAGLYGIGQLQSLLLVGNQIVGDPSLMAGLQVQELAGSKDLLIANNTIVNCGPALCVWDTDVHGDRIEVAANLILTQSKGKPDLLFVKGSRADPKPTGAGNAEALAQRWKLHRNWREASDFGSEPGWLAPGSHDELHGTIDVLSRESGEPDFLRPAADSPLAAGGAGGDLPPYVGAVPPTGLKSWDWQQTWESRHPK